MTGSWSRSRTSIACGDPACWCRLPRLDDHGCGYVFSTGARYRYTPRKPWLGETVDLEHAQVERSLWFDVVYFQDEANKMLTKPAGITTASRQRTFMLVAAMIVALACVGCCAILGQGTGEFNACATKPTKPPLPPICDGRPSDEVCQAPADGDEKRETAWEKEHVCVEIPRGCSCYRYAGANWGRQLYRWAGTRCKEGR